MKAITRGKLLVTFTNYAYSSPSGVSTPAEATFPLSGPQAGSSRHARMAQALRVGRGMGLQEKPENSPLGQVDGSAGRLMITGRVLKLLRGPFEVAGASGIARLLPVQMRFGGW